MRKPALGSSKAPKGLPISSSDSIPAPVGGWNDLDAAANMPPLDAVKMKNWFPETSDVRVRKGQSKHFTGLYQAVESLMVYNSNDGTQQMFAAAETNEGGLGPQGAFYDVTVRGNINDLLTDRVLSDLQSIRWNSENFTNSGGTSYLVCCSDAADSGDVSDAGVGDRVRLWDGSTWSNATLDVTNINITNNRKFVYCFAHKRRLFFLSTRSLDLHYLPIDSVGGTMNTLPLGGIATRGGYLMAGATWTLDAGEGPDDYLAVVTSEGQVIVYSGTNPASDYSLVGVWNLSEPLGRRCFIKYRGDLLYLGRDGLWPLSKALIGAQADKESSLTFKISRAMTRAADSYKANFGWQPLFFPKANMIMVNVPTQEGSFQDQYAMNTITGAWGQFSGVSANCWAIMDGEAYFGSAGFVGKFWDTNADDGQPIDSDLWQAYNYLGSRGVLKQIKSMRPNITSSGTPSFYAGVNVDFEEGDTSLVASAAGNVGVWGSSNWDESVWSGETSYYGEWVSATGIGTAIGPRLQTSSNDELRYQSMDLLYETGTVIG